MVLTTTASPVYLPEADQESVLRLGLKKLDPHRWLLVDDDFAQFHHNKLTAFEQFPDRVYQALPESLPAQQELQALVLNHLLTDHDQLFRVAGNRLVFQPRELSWPLDECGSLWDTSLWVQEDLCLLERCDSGYKLTAASLCAPSNWKLEDKIGRSLDAIHGPVPGYQRSLSQRVSRLFDRLHSDRPLLRYNWSIQPTPQLLWRPDGAGETMSAAPADSPAGPREHYWRVERQTLRRLPETGAIVFTIRIFIHGFRHLSRLPEFDANLGRLLNKLPAEEIDYKGLRSVLASDQYGGGPGSPGGK